MVNQPQYLTLQELKKLEDRLKFLQDVRRPEVAERLRQALEEGGDLSQKCRIRRCKK